MKTKMIKTLVLAFGLAACAGAMADGNVYEIVPCTQSGTALSGPIASVKHPLVAGETVYFKLRMPRTLDMKLAGKQWTLVHHGMSDIIDDFFSPLMIGIYVSGQLTYARYVNYVDSSADIRDFIFTYTTKPGDFALPIRLAGNGGPVGYGDSSSEYLLLNSDKWTVEDGNGNPAVFQFGSTFDVPVSPSTSSGRQLDYSLAGAGFYVKSISFDPAWESAAYWRMVHSGSTFTDSLTPRLVADSAPTNAVTLHVWSMNEDIIKIKGGREVEMTVAYEGGNPIKQTVHIGDITFAAGQTQVNFADMGFELEGGDQLHVGQFTNIVLSAYEDYSYNKSYVRQVDYVTVPVQCSEALPPTLIVEVDTATVVAPVREDGDMYRSTAQVSVYLSQAYDYPLEVTVTPSFAHGAWGDYVRFSKTQTETSVLPAATAPTVIIPANSTGKQSLFLYALRADENTQGDENNQIVLTPSFDDAAAATVITDIQKAGVWISAAKPEIRTPSAGAEISSVSGDEYELTVAVADTVADLADTTTGYQVWFKAGATAKGGLLDGYWIMKDGALVNKDNNNPLKVTYPSSGDQQSQIYVISPISKKKSDTVTFTAHIAEARTSTVETTDGTGNVYNEGDQATFKVTLSDKNETGGTIYAFLKASDNAVAGMFSGTPLFVVCNDTDPTKTQGLAINKNQIATPESKIKLLDGLSEDAGGLSLTFEVVLCTTPQYSDDPNNRVAGYDSNYLNLTVFNVEPIIKRIEMNGFESEYDGYQFATVPKGMWQKFKAVVADKGAYDLETNFKTKWTVSRNGQQKGNLEIVGNPNDDANVYSNNFTQAGTWVVKCQVKDKDMDDWSDITYSVTFEVLDSPHVTLVAEETYFENASRAKITVGLDYWDEDRTTPLTVRLAVGPYAAGRPNPGKLKLDTNYFVETVADVDYYDIPLSGDNYSGLDVDIVEMDGTDNAKFSIHGEVTTTDVLPTSETPANDYYLGVSTTVVIDDVLPVVTITPDPAGVTNRIEVAGGQSSYKIRWNVRSDVPNDFTYTYSKWPEAGIKIIFSGPDNWADGCTNITEATSGEFSPNFGDMQGDVDVVLLIETKDGSLEPYTWHFYVRPSKFLKTLSTGPSGGTTTSALSQRYYRMNARGGLGEGHTFVSGASFSKAENFELSWNCGRQTYMSAYAFGYKFTDGPTMDNNWLNSTTEGEFDVGIDKKGNQKGDRSLTDWYEYTPADGKDSFFYLWILTTLDENGAATDIVLGNTISPEVAGPPGKGRIPLPTEQTEDGSYVDTIAEAIFSKEWYPEDNLGDINQDGIPDTFAVTVWGSGASLIQATTGLDDLLGDLNDIAAGNPDEDYIPGVWQAQGKLNLVNKELASYAPIGYPLNNRLELRGFHYGLNETSLTLSDVCFSTAETNAYKAFFKAKNNADWTEADGFDLNFWCPEPRGKGEQYRMDPTMDDTDSDGMPDGWEYFFWYQAKVWAPGNDNLGKKKDGQLFVFERFNANDILRGTEIKAEDVLKRFDPCVELDTTVDKFNPDFDGDGLTDMEELVIGTNPCHWDTDADHMCDGWEVMHSLDPLNGSKVGNPDGDFMAYTELSRYFAAEISNDNGPSTYVFDLGLELIEGRDYEETDIPMYAMKGYYESNGFYIRTASPKDANGDDNYPLYYYLDADGNMRYTVNENETDDDGNPLAVLRYTSMGAITIRDVPLTAALIAPEKLDANGRAYLYGLESDAPPVPIPPVWHWSYPMLDHKLLSQDDGEPIFRRGGYTIPDGTMLIHTGHILIHDQVHAAFGFDPRTGWYKNGAGYVADRWNPQINTALSPTDSTGVAVNTDPYTDYDEYLVMRYRHDFGIQYYNDGKYDPGDIWSTFLAFTTKPNIVYAKTDIEAILNPTNGTESATTNDTESATAYDTETAANLLATANISEYLANAFAEAGSTKSPVKGHGADTDGDGVPDGWELYKYRNPNAAPARPPAVGREGFSEPWDKEELDGTPDGLGWTAEYAGTDSCNAYKDCPSIYNNHPGLHPAGEGFQQGWFNKFFPTDPDNPDTDGDGIFDGYEGLAWRGTWYNGGLAYIVAPAQAGMTFIYGNPQDSITCCVRGGGMNPCTVDTDIDGLPDPWEMSYAGIVVDAAARKYVGPAPDFDPDIDDATFTADGLNEAGLTISNIVYICGGMDATWGGDGWTDPLNDGNSTDTLLGTRRDVDFDHDGLQNYQEYLVQQVRHFRYDDITTPLMGRYMDEGEYDPLNPTGPLLSNHVHNQSPAFTPMMQNAGDFVMTTLQNWADGVGVSFVTNTIGRTITVNEFTGAEMTNLIYEVVTNITPGSTIVADKYYGDGYNYMFSTPWVAAGWRQNGYMASPTHYWDRMITCEMIQPSIMMPPAGAYVSTDPRVADTDGDGMDDYYEMFHGLNPILGSTAAGAKDIIAQAWGMPQFYNAFWNEWTHKDFNRIAALMGMTGSIENPLPLQDPTALDPLLYPWAMGAGEADPDGDGLRNDSERVTANLTSPMTTHTDPTPLWFTDSSSANSYVSQYYLNTAPVSAMPFWPLLVGFDDPYSPQTPDGGYGGLQYLYPFEENEGYDTDNDWKGDGNEIVTTTRPASDPLDFSDPSRRQALYLDGNQSWVQSRAMFSRDIFTGNIPSATTVDLFKQFTVEAWICPEKTGEQTIIDRCSAYGYDAINKDAAAIRSNFRIGLTADGRVYGMFDNDDAIESGYREGVSCQTVTGPQVPLNKWTHVAMTYDGNALVLYVNGIERSRAATHLIPANGVTVIVQDPTYTNSFTQTSYEAVPGAFFIGGRPVASADGGASMFNIANADYAFMRADEWYQGFVDEVRIWDGARTGSDIAANYTKKLSKAEVSENREEVYAHLMSANADSSRNDNDGLLKLAPELVQLYDFSTLPGAVLATDVAKIPSGFDTSVGGQLVSAAAVAPSFSQNVGWWDSCLTKSTVYDDYTVVPWVENAVHHLPVMDGSVVDSFLYSDYLGGYATLASKHGLEKYALNNSSMPYAFHNYFLERYQRLFKLNLLMAVDPEDALVVDLVCRYEYEIRSDFIGTSDLVPMGGAYAKTAPALWDGAGAADVWEYTSVDTDADGLPDWWEDLYGLDPASRYDWNTVIDWNGAQIPAYIAYTVDLSLGMQPDGQYHPEYASTVDADDDNIPDWWEKLFGVEAEGQEDDSDRDGLTNYAEYMISFGPHPYGITNGWAFVSPINAFSTSADQKVTDYYLRAPQAFDANGRHVNENEYFGEIFTDHDFMENWWEKAYSLGFVNSRVYDPDKDSDGDFWSNWAEARTYMWRGAYSADLIDNYYDVGYNHINDYPRPALGLRFTYNGICNITSAGLMVRATTGRSPRVDATFNVNYDSTKVSAATSIIGGYYDNAATIHGFLNPGSLIPGATQFTMCHLSGERTYEWTVGRGDSALYRIGSFAAYVRDIRLYGANNVTLIDTELPFDPLAMTTSDSSGRKGDIIVLAEASASGVGASIGTINFLTGEYEISLERAVSVGVNLDGMVLRAEYTYAIPNEWPKTFWLSEPTSGWVREGLNTIEAWIDLNGDGAYTAGEPYGVVRNVNVGWHKTSETVIELKDTSPIIPHYLLSDGSSDRAVVLGASSGVMAAAETGGEGGGEVGGEASGLTEKVAVRRVGLNGQRVFGTKTVPVRTLVSKTVILDDRAYLTEADVLSDDKFDLDCKWLVSDAMKLGLTVADLKSAEYEIDQVVEYADGTSSNIVLATFSNVFNKQRSVPVTRAPLADAPVYSAAPTFYWSCADDTMTAFRLQVSTSTNASDVVYDSGVRQLPGRDSIAVGVMAHAFTPPLYVDDVVATNGAPVFADVTNYYWRVAELNAKYSDVDAKSWSVWTPFQMDVANENRYPKQPTGYGQCGAVVRYFGPGEAPEGQVIVEVHSSADFAGQPLAQIRADITQLGDMYDVETVNAAFKGVAPGTVYLMAYIDMNNNGKRDVNESWGYANYVGTDNVAIFTPRGVTVTDEIGRCPSLVVYIEDTDVNRNEIPDCLESAAASSESAMGDSDRDGLFDNEEDGYATDASVWDTDGDGMPDGWESSKFADLDPNFDDAAEVAEGDVMAFALMDCTIVTVQNTDGSDSVNYIFKGGQKTPMVGDSIDGYALYATYAYPVVEEDGSRKDYYGRGAEVVLEAAAGTTNRVVAVQSGTVALVHAQVYDEFGFDSRTANPTAYADKKSVNTKPFTALDKYLVIRYFEALGICDEDDVNVNRKWAQFSLKPLVVDSDRDGVADGWELYVMFGPTQDKAAAFAADGEVVSPWNFYDRFKAFDGGDLPLVGEYDGGNMPTDPWNVDTDGDGITDGLAWEYHLKGTDGVKDFDGDGLSNYVEYLLAEVFNIAEFSPDDAYSVNRNVPDYFFRLNELYVGEIFTDHDRIRDQWESGYYVKDDDVSPYVYDERLDPDGDGWSNYAEFQSGTDPTKLGSLSIDAVQMDEYPVPTIELKISYNGNQSVGDKAVVVKAWSDPNLVTIPDAVWTLGGAGTVSVTENGNSNIVTGVKYFGMNPMREMLLHLSPGSVVPGSVKFEFKDLAWILYNELTGVAYLNDPVTAIWSGGIIDQQRNDGSGFGDVVSQDDTSKSLGTINYATGEMRVDFASFSDEFSIVGDIAGRLTGDGWYSIYNLHKSYVRVNWQSKLIAGSTVTTYYLSEADRRSAGNNSLGHVKEGANTFIAFYDLDGDGNYTAGEPYGCVTGVDVGWNYARAEIELTDTNPISARICCITGTAGGSDSTTSGSGATGGTLGLSDRQVLWGTEHGDIPAEKLLVSQETGGEYMHIRVVRTLIDGEDCTKYNVPAKVVLDKEYLCVDSERYITEADFLKNGALDIDWQDLANDLSKGNINGLAISNVTYRIVMGEGDVSNTATNNCVGAFNRWFDSQAVYNASKPILLDDDQVVTAVSPTFKWAIPNGLGTYTAFRITITGSGFAWDSGFQRMPPRIMDPGADYKCHYEWTAPICVDDMVAINGRTAHFANNTRYAWNVTVANARFRENWSAQGHFRMNVPEPSQECGTARVAVRYYGPSTVANGAVVRVEAFSTPDFSGEPVSRGYVTNKADIASTDAITVANATLPGLKVGSYYIRAYIDTQSDGICQDWESWGCYCTRDTTLGTIYTPRSVTVGPEFGTSMIIPVYIDDCDTDRDCLPDAWEWASNGNLSTYGSAQIDQTATGGFALKTSLGENLRSGGSPSGGLAVMVNSVLSSPRIAAQIVGVDATGTDEQVNAALANVSAEAEATPVAVAITAIALDRTAGTVSISADTEGATVGSFASEIYTIPAGSDTLELTCKVLHRDSLDSGDWTVIKTEKVTIEKKSRTYTFDLGSSPIDLSSGFFKVSLEK